MIKNRDYTLTKETKTEQKQHENLLIRVLKKAEAKESVNLGEQLKELTSNIITRMMFRKMQSDSDGGNKTEEVIKMVVEIRTLISITANNPNQKSLYQLNREIRTVMKRLEHGID